MITSNPSTLDLDITTAIPLRSKNIPALTWTEPLRTRLIKHIDSLLQVFKEKVQEKLVKISYISSNSNNADIFRKPFPIDSHHKHCEMLGLKV